LFEAKIEKEHIINIWNLQAQSVREANADILDTGASRAAPIAAGNDRIDGNHREPRRKKPQETSRKANAAILDTYTTLVPYGVIIGLVQRKR